MEGKEPIMPCKQAKTGSTHWDEVLSKFYLSDEVLEAIRELREDEQYSRMITISQLNEATSKLNNLKNALKEVLK